MRAAFGLLSLLIVIAIIMILMNMNLGPGGPVQKGREAQEEIRPLTGRDEDGVRASDSIKMQPTGSGNNRGVLVADLMRRGPMENHFGLQKGDVIVAIGVRGLDKPQEIRDLPGGPDMGESLVLEAYNFRLPLVVERNGQRVTLPQPGAAPTAPTAGANPANPANPADLPTGPGDAASPSGDSSLKRQLDAIKVPTH